MIGRGGFETRPYKYQGLERDNFSSNHYPALTFCLSMIFFRKPVPTFRDHALNLLRHKLVGCAKSRCEVWQRAQPRVSRFCACCRRRTARLHTLRLLHVLFPGSPDPERQDALEEIGIPNAVMQRCGCKFLALCNLRVGVGFEEIGRAVGRETEIDACIAVELER